jgi:hypothetical protein
MSEAEGQIKRLVLSAVDECAVCGQEYQPDDVDVIGSRGSLWVLMVRCPRCRKQGFIAALLNGQEPPSAPLVDDDHLPAERGEPVTAADVLEMRDFLAGFHGDLGEYLARQSP